VIVPVDIAVANIPTSRPSPAAVMSPAPTVWGVLAAAIVALLVSSTREADVSVPLNSWNVTNQPRVSAVPGSATASVKDPDPVTGTENTTDCVAVPPTILICSSTRTVPMVAVPAVFVRSPATKSSGVPRKLEQETVTTIRFPTVTSDGAEIVGLLAGATLVFWPDTASMVVVGLGLAEGDDDGETLSLTDGLTLGDALGLALGDAEGETEGETDGETDGDALGERLGE